MYSSKEITNKDNIVVEMKVEKTEKTEKSVLLKGINGSNKPPSDQVTIETVDTFNFIAFDYQNWYSLPQTAGYFWSLNC